MPAPPRFPAPPGFIAKAALLVALTATGGCSERQSGPVAVSVVGTREELADPIRHSLSPAGKLMLEATAQGLVAFDARGDILPALAQRWIVEDDGRSYIFRLRRARWPDGTAIDAKTVARLLQARIDANLALDPYGDLAAVEEVVAMTGEVIEIRLAAARPFFLQMLAQPQMAITRRDGGTGPYRRDRRPAAWFLRPVTDDDGEEEEEPPAAWENRVLRAERPARAIVRFREGLSALVLGGRFSDLPLLNLARVENRAVRVDPVQGLFGLAVVGEGPFLKDDAVRAALNMAIDRDRLPASFGLGGWAVSPVLVPQQLDLPRMPTAPPWSALPLDERRASARAAIARWSAAHGDVPALRIALPAGPGARLLYQLVAADLHRIGVPSHQVALDADADLRLIDEVAAYDSARWYLGRVSCARGLSCSPLAEQRLAEAGQATTPEAVQAMMAEAEALTVAHNGYIALGLPVRWSLVSRPLTGFMPSTRARHPLNHLFGSTN